MKFIFYKNKEDTETALKQSIFEKKSQIRRIRRQSDLLGFYPLAGFEKAWDNFFSPAKALRTHECFVVAGAPTACQDGYGNGLLTTKYCNDEKITQFFFPP